MENKKSGFLKAFLFLIILGVLFVLIFNNKSQTEDVPVEENLMEIDMSLGEENGEALPQ